MRRKGRPLCRQRRRQSDFRFNGRIAHESSIFVLSRQRLWSSPVLSLSQFHVDKALSRVPEPIPYICRFASFRAVVSVTFSSVTFFAGMVERLQNMKP
jgi:hypothetical protein